MYSWWVVHSKILGAPGVSGETNRGNLVSCRSRTTITNVRISTSFHILPNMLTTKRRKIRSGSKAVELVAAFNVIQRFTFRDSISTDIAEPENAESKIADKLEQLDEILQWMEPETESVSQARLFT